MLSRLLILTQAEDSQTNALGPGPTTLALGDMSAGYFGPVSSSEVFTATGLRAALSITSGTLWNDAPDWIKFAHNGRVKYIASKPMAYSLTWQALYLAGAVYPNTGVGNYPPVGQTPTQQGKVVTNSQGYKFTSSLISVGDDPAPIGATPAITSEFALITRMMNGTWASSTYQEWGVNNFSPYMWIMQSATDETNTKLSISYLSNSINGYSTDPNDNRNILHWRPILTLQ